MLPARFLLADLAMHPFHDDQEQGTAWQTVTINDKIISLPLAVTLDGIYYRTDRLKELGVKEPTPDWTWDEISRFCQDRPRCNHSQGCGASIPYRAGRPGPAARSGR